MKKKLESRLAQGVRQVKSQAKPEVNSPRGQQPIAADTAPAAKSAAAPAPTSTATMMAVPAAQASAINPDNLHPRRVWPD